jgi:hypothetical protein
MPIARTAGARSDGSAAAAVLALAAFERWARRGKRRVIAEGRIQRLGSRHRKARSASAAARDAARSASSRTHRLYVEHLIAVLREVQRVLRPDGTLWLVIGDSYAGTLRSVVETLSKSGLSMGVPLVERPTSLSNA